MDTISLESIDAELQAQAEEIGEKNLADFRICAICLGYTARSTYDDHMSAHGYETLHLQWKQ